MKAAPKNKKQPIEPPKFESVILSLGPNFSWAEIHGRPLTAVGIEAPSPWRTGTIFPGSLEQLQEHYRQIEEAKQTAEAEQRERLRAAERARERRHCPPVLSRADLSALRVDPELVSMVADEPEITEICKPVAAGPVTTPAILLSKHPS